MVTGGRNEESGRERETCITIGSKYGGVVGCGSLDVFEQMPDGLFFFILRRSFALVTQAGVQWRDFGSLQPLPPGFK